MTFIPCIQKIKVLDFAMALFKLTEDGKKYTYLRRNYRLYRTDEQGQHVAPPADPRAAKTHYPRMRGRHGVVADLLLADFSAGVTSKHL